MPSSWITVERNYAIRIYSARIKVGVPELVARTIAKIDTAAKAAAPYKTGTLKRSIISQMTGEATGLVGSRGVPYARIQDIGGTTPPHIIRARYAQALYWPGAAHPVKSVNHPGSKIPGNRYLSNAVADGLDEFNAELRRLLTP
jgi:hypothetical protein